MSREALEALIRALGYDVHAFASAQDYLKSDRISDTTCLISDVQMPGMTGLDLQKRLIADGFRIPTIFVTGLFREAVRAAAMAAGAVAFLEKPVDAQSLRQCIKKALRCLD